MLCCRDTSSSSSLTDLTCSHVRQWDKTEYIYFKMYRYSVEQAGGHTELWEVGRIWKFYTCPHPHFFFLFSFAFQDLFSGTNRVANGMGDPMPSVGISCYPPKEWWEKNNSKKKWPFTDDVVSFLGKPERNVMPLSELPSNYMVLPQSFSRFPKSSDSTPGFLYNRSSASPNIPSLLEHF